MRGLMLHRSNEKGAIAIIVAVLFGFGVMIAAAALTIDVGNINADRRQLQNGADAVAMSAAQDCVTTVCPNPSPTTGTATDVKAKANYAKLIVLANNNAADGATRLARVDSGVATSATDPNAVCGTLPGLPLCGEPDTSSTSNLQECPTPSSSVKYIRVYAQTLDKSKTKTLLPYSFGAAIAGAGAGANQQACASVGVGPPGDSPDTLPVVVAKCAYDTMIAKNNPPFPVMDPIPGASQTTPVPFPTKGGPDAAGAYPTVDYWKYVMTIETHTSGGGPGSGQVGPAKCTATSPSGLFLPGGFGWTKTKDDTACKADFKSDTGTVPISNGGAIPDGCKNNGTSPLSFVGKTVNIPVMTGQTADGKSYTIDGLAGFYVAGYRAPAAKQPNAYAGYTDNATFNVPNLTGGDDGFWGWFTDKYETKSNSFGLTTDAKGPRLIKYIG